MSPNAQRKVSNLPTSSNIYTIILAFAFAIVLTTAAFVAYMCYFQYGTIFKMP